MSSQTLARDLHSLPLNALFELVANVARLRYDGHYAVCSFGSGYKGAFGTPRGSGDEDRVDYDALPNSRTLELALIRMLLDEPCFDEIADQVPTWVAEAKKEP